MEKTLFLTYKELEEILDDTIKPYKIIEKEILDKSKSRTYMSVIFKDLSTELFYRVEYTIHDEFGIEIDEYGIQYLDKKIEIVKEELQTQNSSNEENEIIEESEISLLQKEYQKIEKIDFDIAIHTIPLKEMNKLKSIFDKNSLTKLTIDNLYTIFLKAAIKYKIDVDKLKNFAHSNKKHLGTPDEQILKLQKEILKINKLKVKIEKNLKG